MEHWGFKMEKDEIPLGKAENLKGQKFGKLTVLYRVKPPEHVKNKTVYWKCKCDCGKIHITNARSLKGGHTTSCGCNKGPRPENAKVIDETGNQYGLLTVIERAGSNKTGQALWKCKCKCGNETIIEGTRLRYGDTKSCGCLVGKSNVKLIPPGTRFSHLTILMRAGSENGRATYKCQCDCGNTIILNSNALRRGNNTTCGHCKLRYQPTPEEWLALTHEDEVPLGRAENLSGQRFGLLTALYRTKVPETSKSEHEAFWKCQCDCGNFTTVIASALKNGTSQSCGCGRNFRGEEKIQNILQDNNLIFVREKTFKDCISNQKGKLRFDFYINENYLIEYDGQQHFYAVGNWGGEEQFQKTQLYDNIKNEYCKTHNIPLIRIPYTHYDKITIDDLRPETSQFLIT